MSRTKKLNNYWLIQIENKDNHQRISVYDSGLVYGTEQGQVIGTLTSETSNRIKGILTGKLDERGNLFNKESASSRINYLYFFKNEPYQKYNHNNLILRIRDDSRRHRNIKIVGWYVTSNILSIIKNPKNWI